MTQIASCVLAALALGLSACTNLYDPVQRGFAGGLWGAASGAAIGAAAGGGPGAALGAAVGGATGIFGGVASLTVSNFCCEKRLFLQAARASWQSDDESGRQAASDGGDGVWDVTLRSDRGRREVGTPGVAQVP